MKVVSRAESYKMFLALANICGAINFGMAFCDSARITWNFWA